MEKVIIVKDAGQFLYIYTNVSYLYVLTSYNFTELQAYLCTLQ